MILNASTTAAVAAAVAASAAANSSSGGGTPIHPAAAIFLFAALCIGALILLAMTADIAFESRFTGRLIDREVPIALFAMVVSAIVGIGLAIILG